MGEMPAGYDEWKTRSPDDENPRCEYCGASEGRYSSARSGWQPESCTGECGKAWRDPDYERDLAREG